MQQLSGTDTGFLYAEQGNMYNHVASLAIYDPSTAVGGNTDGGIADGSPADRSPVRFKDILAHFKERLHVNPLFRRRQVEAPLGVDRPYWVEDPDFDLEYHVRRIGCPAPGGQHEFCQLVAELYSRPLDSNRPLWQMWVIEGLEDGAVGIVTMLHHAYTDGMSGARNFACGSIPLQKVKTIARQYDANVNDVVMAICDHAMVQYLSEKGEAPQQGLTGMMAVSTRVKGDQSSSNAATVAPTGLGEPGADIVIRLQQVNRETGKVKEDIGGKSPATLFYSNLVLTIATQLSLQIPGLNDRLPPATNLFVSNIPGMTDKPMYLGSALMSGVYTAPIVQVGIPVNTTLVSYHGQLCFGFGAASEVMADTAHYASLCFQAFDELTGKTLGKKPSRVTRRKSGVAAAPRGTRSTGRKRVAAAPSVRRRKSAK